MPDTGSNQPVVADHDRIFEAILAIDNKMDTGFKDVGGKLHLVDKSLDVMFERVDNHLRDENKHPVQPCAAVTEIKGLVEDHKKGHRKVTMATITAVIGSGVAALFALLRTKFFGG